MRTLSLEIFLRNVLVLFALWLHGLVVENPLTHLEDKMESENVIVERLTRILSMLICNQNHAQATNSKYCDVPVSSQEMDHLTIACYRESVPIMHNGKAVVSRRDMTRATLALVLKSRFENEVDAVLDGNDLPMWVNSFVRFATAEVDWAVLADQWTSDLASSFDRAGVNFVNPDLQLVSEVTP